MDKPKFSIGELVLYYDGLFRVSDAFGFPGQWFYKLGKMPLSVSEGALSKPDDSDITRILKGGKIM